MMEQCGSTIKEWFYSDYFSYNILYGNKAKKKAMRVLEIKLKDTKTGVIINCETTLEEINKLYDEHKLNGITDLVHTLNDTLNNVENDFELRVPNDWTELKKFRPDTMYSTSDGRHGHLSGTCGTAGFCEPVEEQNVCDYDRT